MLFNLSTLLTFSLLSLSLSLASTSPYKRPSNLHAPHRFDRVSIRQEGVKVSVPVVDATIQTVSVVAVANAALATAPVGIGAKVLGFSSLVAGQTGGVAVAASTAAAGGIGAKVVASSVGTAGQVQAVATSKATAKAENTKVQPKKTGVKTVFQTKTVTVTAPASPAA